MGKIVFFIILLFSNYLVYSQSKQKPLKQNTIYVEGLGAGYYYSINYEHSTRKSASSQAQISFRIGLEYLQDVTPFLSIPFEFSAILGKKNSYLDIGIVASYWRGTKSRYFFVGPGLGYRLQRSQGGFFLKTGLLFLLNVYEYEAGYYDTVISMPFELYPRFRLGLGYSFRAKTKN